MIESKVSEAAAALHKAYEDANLPGHPKKSVQQALQAEVQGAWVDGQKGVMCAKPSKICKYVRLALEVIKRGKASQRELQVVGGVLSFSDYISMFKRPLMSGLNFIWS